MSPVAKNSRAPSTERVAKLLRAHYLSGKTPPNQFLPGERELASRYGVARVTVRRALQQLVAEGLLRAEPGRGYRALMRVAGLRPGSAAAHVYSAAEERTAWSYTARELAASLQHLLVEDGWQALSLSSEGRSPQEVVRVLADAGAWGTVLDSGDEALFEAVYASGLPCVSVDYQVRSLPVDSILQDNHGGGMLAAEYLLDRGHRKIAWFGEVGATEHSRERFTGAEAAFLKHGRELPREYVTIPESEETAERTARELLSRADRPTAVLAMWTGISIGLARGARSLGLEIGKDLELVAWATEEGYRSHVEREFGAGKAPPTVVWSTEEMARIAVSRLLWHVRDPDLKPLRVSVPTRLIASAEEQDHA